MAGNISLEASIRTCKIDQGWADKVYSDRFLNPNSTICPIWNGTDDYGRFVSSNTFNTQAPGCQSAYDRMYVENYLRPQYTEFINISANGIRGNLYGEKWNNNPFANPSNWNREYANVANAQQLATGSQIGRFGQQLNSEVFPKCGAIQYARGMQAQSQNNRAYQSVNLMNNAQRFRAASGALNKCV